MYPRSELYTYTYPGLINTQPTICRIDLAGQVPSVRVPSGQSQLKEDVYGIVDNIFGLLMLVSVLHRTH